MKDSQQERADKINSLQEMIANAEQTISSAKQMLTHLQGGESTPPPAPASIPSTISAEQQNGERVIHGTFNGQIMIGEDGRNYPVQANYASKSKLVEGDMLKLTITPDGNFMYKQIGPIDRKYLIGIVQRDDRGNFIIQTEEKPYRVLLAAATYFKIEEGDEVTIVAPKVGQSEWGAIENVVRKSSEGATPVAPRPALPQEIQEENIPSPSSEAPSDPHPQSKNSEPEESEEEPASALQRLEEEIEQERRSTQKQEKEAGSSEKFSGDQEASQLEDDDSLEKDWEAESDQIAQSLNEEKR